MPPLRDGLRIPRLQKLFNHQEPVVPVHVIRLFYIRKLTINHMAVNLELLDFRSQPSVATVVCKWHKQAYRG